MWFALTFWIFLETRSVFATGMIAGILLVLTASLAIWFGSLVDHHRKREVMIASIIASLALYGVARAQAASSRVRSPASTRPVPARSC